MAKLSEVELARLIRLGSDAVPAFAKDFSDDDLWATAAYLRSLSFDASPLTQSQPAPATPTLIASDAGTPSAETTPIGTDQASAEVEATQVLAAGFGNIQGTIVNKLGTDLPPDFVITVHGF